MFSITYDLARRMATDAADRNMRECGRTVWGPEDYNVAWITFEALLDDLGDQEGQEDTQ